MQIKEDYDYEKPHVYVNFMEKQSASDQLKKWFVIVFRHKKEDSYIL